MGLDTRLVILQAVTSPYKSWLYHYLSEDFPNLHVVYFSESESIRSWDTSQADYNYNYTILKPGPLESHNPIAISVRLIAELNRLDPEIVIIPEYVYLPYWFGLFWSLFNKKLLIFFSESTAIDNPKKWIKEWIKRQMVSRCHWGIAQGSRSAAYMATLGMNPSNITIKGYSTNNQMYATGADAASVDKASIKLGLGLLEIVILYVGRLAPEKNIPRLLTAFKTIATENLAVSLLIVGNGPLESELHNQVMTENIPRVVFHPFVQSTDVPKFYGIADIFILPSLREPWGLVVNEAMSAGVPVVVSNRAGSAADLISPDTGIIIDPMDTDEISRSLKFLIDSPSERLRLSENARKKIGHFSSKNSAKRMAEGIERAQTYYYR
ncbi:glycosyltransferase family 1 protein [bacterium]|nr:glycosyltransferase family 1 protein [bacterium]